MKDKSYSQGKDQNKYMQMKEDQKTQKAEQLHIHKLSQVSWNRELFAGNNFNFIYCSSHIHLRL